MKYCTHCGAPIDDLAKFCSACGQECLQVSPQSTQPQSDPYNASEAPVQTDCRQAEPYAGYTQPQAAAFNAYRPEAQASAYQSNSAQPPITAQKRGNWAGIVGFILSICALLICLLPYYGVEIGLFGLVFSIIGICLAKKRNGKKGLAIAGTVISAVVIAFSLLWTTFVVKLLTSDVTSESIDSFMDQFSDYSEFSDFDFSDYSQF